MYPARVCTATSFPLRSWLMGKFWQKTQRRGQPLKKMVPDPRVPEIGGSSPWWRFQLATFGR